MRFGKLVGRFKVGVASAVLAVALAGCTEPTPTGKLPDTPSSTATSAAESSAAPTSAAPTRSAAPTTTYTPEEQAVIDQYKGFYSAFYGLQEIDEATIRAAFEPFAIPPAVTAVTNRLLDDYAQKGERPSGSVVFGVIHLTLNNTVADVTECRDGSTEMIVSAVDGSVISHGGPGTLLTVQLEQSNGVWLVVKANGAKNSC